jgi:diguanylate cyclase (GGDEF)-like protein
MTDDRHDATAETRGSGSAPAASDVSGFDRHLLEVAAEDVEATPREAQRLDEQRRRLGRSFYASLISALAGLQRSESKSEQLWRTLLEHKYHMSTHLGRNVGIRVAAIDYFTNITGEIRAVSVVDSETYVATSVMAVTDGLTRLYNHRYFQDRLREELAEARRAARPLSVIVLDIDYFKNYNDVNGHIAGDVTLHKIAQIMREVVGDRGVSARYGGEEFALLLPDFDKDAAARIAESIRESVARTSFPNAFVLPEGVLSLSAGLAEFPCDAEGPVELVDFADRAMFEAKRCGRNRVCHNAPNRRHQPRRRFRAPLPLELEDGQRVEATTIDLSVNGLLCSLGSNLRPQQAARITLPDAVAGGGEKVVGVTVRSDRIDRERWLVAFRFVGLPRETEDALRRFVEEGLSS